MQFCYLCYLCFESHIETPRDKCNSAIQLQINNSSTVLLCCLIFLTWLKPTDKPCAGNYLCCVLCVVCQQLSLCVLCAVYCVLCVMCCLQTLCVLSQHHPSVSFHFGRSLSSHLTFFKFGSQVFPSIIILGSVAIFAHYSGIRRNACPY